MSRILLAENRTTDYRIVCAVSDDPAVRSAAGELSSYFTKLTGASIAVVGEDTAASPREIVVGIARNAGSIISDIDALGEDGFVIRCDNETLYLLGKTGRGTLYAVYEFLERFAGCRFYASYFEKIPALDSLSVPADTDIREIPVFEVRNTFWSDYINNDRFSAKRRNNGKKSSVQIAADCGGSARWAGGMCHTLFALAEMTGDHINHEPCLSDPQVYETVLKNVRAWLAEHPGARFISVSQNDSYADGIGCMCEKCAALLEKTGSYAGSYILFVNRIADAIRDEYPDVKLHTFAYRFTRKAPIGVRPRPNVMVELCTIEGCFRHPLNECDAIDDPHMKSDAFASLITQWSSLCDTLSVWDYTTNFAHYSLTFPNFGVLRKNVQLFADRHTKFLFEQGAYTSRNAEFCELRGYLFSKLLWDPYMSEDEYRRLANEFIDDYYGAGADAVRDYLALAMASTKDHHMTVYDHPMALYPNEKQILRSQDEPASITQEMLDTPDAVDWTPYLTWYSALTPHALITEGKRLFASAIAAENDPVLREHIETSALQVTYLESYYRRAALDLARENLDAALTSAGADTAVKEAILQSVLAAREDDYRRFNSDMIDAMLAHGATDIREGFRLTGFDRAQLHLERDPLGWL